MGDFNIHVADKSKTLSKAFLDLIDFTGFTYVGVPTHLYSHTLDLVLIRGLFTFKATLCRLCVSHSDTYTTCRTDSTIIHKLAEKLESAVTTIDQPCCPNKFTDHFNLTLLDAFNSVQ